jgi:GNAT superfamily N-acetyltransferase
MRLYEIENLRSIDYRGGQEELIMFAVRPNDKRLPLPGGSGFEYVVQAKAQFEKVILLIDPSVTPPKALRDRSDFDHDYQYWEWKKSQPLHIIGMLILEQQYVFPIENTWQVEAITIDKKYRGRGLGNALYGIALSQLHLNLVSGDSQTPDGRQNWARLASIPGCEVMGIAKIEDEDLDEDQIDTLMMLGGHYLGGKKYSRFTKHFFGFPISISGAQIVNAMSKSSVEVNHPAPNYQKTIETLLLAQWTGR